MEKLDVLVDGIALSAYAWGIAPGASIVGAPGRRTADVEVPGRHGVIPAGSAPFEAGSFALSMYVLGCQDDGSVPATATAQRQRFEVNLSKLMLLLTRPGSVTLQRSAIGRPTQTAKARVVAAVQPSVVSGRAARLNVVFEIPGVFWRGPNTDIALGPSSGRVNLYALDGTHEVDDMVVEVYGPTSTRVRLTDVATGEWIESPRALIAGETWLIDGAAHTSTLGGVRVWPERSQSSRLWTLRSRLTATGTPCEVDLSTSVGGLRIIGRGTAL